MKSKAVNIPEFQEQYPVLPEPQEYDLPINPYAPT